MYYIKIMLQFIVTFFYCDNLFCSENVKKSACFYIFRTKQKKARY